MSEIIPLYDELYARGLVREAVLKLVQDIRLAKDFVCMVGSTAENGMGNDIDILVRSPHDRHIETRLYKLFPEEMHHLLHFVWEDSSQGVPHDTYIPLFDLCLIPSKEQAIVEMQERSFRPGKSFIPPKTTVETFFEEPQLKEYLEKHSGKTWAIEQKFDGFRGIAHKSGDVIHIFSDQGRDITDGFPTIAENIKQMSTKDFIIDGELVLFDDRGKPAGRADLIKFVVSKEKPSDKNVRYYVWDIMHLG